ncbi:recombinase family protein [Edwardsiella anguillarum]|uniref:recombinase family protein n=1 Tax=Edwardsiella anguillarum TaxID=1821960 RepID=UPI0024B874ED|nr:recombinase family protein [Edwardsiella anguillarum]WHP81955.1 recombinase family protein [Edwardsiella anguillarum]WHQ19457.1 recombinase family protein [Edwardsiella anguillarum]WHQ23003.1 recombinase family protein [Edwardsiella anguillarum]WHQ26527.1 recombinase family protein [Edwardsiella anguillarum]WHQ30040.1 recombinase family protein [Edwardsiella anguillarum]
MLIGYARVSTQEQDTQAQISALKSAGCELIRQERASSRRWDRLELPRLLQRLRRDDQVIVWKLDRLSRYLKDLLLAQEKIENIGDDFRSITENIDRSSPAGRMMMQIAGSFAVFERAMLRKRTRNGLAAAHQEGRTDGRGPKKSPSQHPKKIVSLVTSGQKTGADAVHLFRVHPSTIGRLIARQRLFGT